MADPAALERFFRPDSLAIVGASPRRGSSRNSLLRVVQRHGFRGRIYPVNPSHGEIEGLPAFPSIAAIPETPDVALIITPAPSVAEVVEQCAAKGIRNAIVYSSGFEEVESGKVHARRLAQAARRHSVAVLGANCQGVWSVRHQAMLTFGAASLRLESLRHAPIAIVSQSGALAGAMGNVLQSQGIGCAYVVSVGNETCLDALDALAWVIEQDDVRAVALYIEGLNDAARILGLAERARRRGVAIVVLKAGRSEIGAQAVASHTGKIASSHAVYRDVLLQAGVLVVDSVAEVITSVEALAYLAPLRIGGEPDGGVSVFGSSGGAGALLADYSAEYRVPLADFGPATADTLQRILPEFARKANPVDLTGQINSDRDLFRNTCRALHADPRTHAIVVQFASSGQRSIEENADAFMTAARDVPFIVSLIGETLDLDLLRSLRSAGVIASPDPSSTMRTLARLYHHARMIDRAPPPRAPVVSPGPPRDWEAMMGWCDQAGITPARWVILQPNDRAASACAGLRTPLAVKVLPSEVGHKSEAGLVALRIVDTTQVDALAAKFRRQIGKPSAGILVQEMADPGVEVVLACLRRTDFGPVLSIGLGGIGIELFRDVVHLALPVDETQVADALRRTKLCTLLSGYRGASLADIDALVRASVRFGDLFLATPGIDEFELNPIIVGARGQGVVAVDALITLRAETGEQR